uniref:Reverse transcriptase Ty1/copia-type domain-containing protein n=1 Tax=Tanacetum cinerariifolium TaxID=118510 RepID=A0A6L2KU44_TANCI|nr:hypothetical protein [Tanacetum cinerariifolium]
MKPQHLSGDSSAVHECTRMVKERLRQAFRATMLVVDTRNESSHAETHISNVEEVKRSNRVLNTIGMSMLAFKGNVLEVRKLDIYFCKPDGFEKQKNLSFIMSCGRYNANLQFGVAERLSQTFRAKSMMLRAEAPNMLWAYSVSMAYLIYRMPYVPIGLRIPEEEWRGKDNSLAHLKLLGYEESPSYPKQRYYICGLDIWSQSPGRSSDTSEGFNNCRSFEDSGRSDEEYYEDIASSNEGGSKTPQVRRSNTESKALVRYSPLANYLLLTRNGEPESYSEALSSKKSVQWKKAIIKEMVSLEKNQTCSLVRILAGKKASQRLWMFKVKEEHNGRKMYKARLVGKGFQQKQRVDYNEIFYKVVKMTAIKFVLSIVAAGAFLCGSLE